VTVSAVSGPSSQRVLIAIAEDASLNSGFQRVTLNVGGVATVAVPNVVGLTPAAASSALTTAGLSVGTVTLQSSATVAAGNVISETPAAGSNVAVGSSVNLVISRGLLPGDLNGDGAVNCTDLAIVKSSFGKRTGQPGFDSRADVNRDGVVNVIDLSTEARQLPAGTTCN
jgi:trimeric autotransporter adhesin